MNGLPSRQIHMKFQVLFSLKNKIRILYVICCSCDWHFKGEPRIAKLESSTFKHSEQGS